MTEITLHNTAKRAKEVLKPLDPENVRMYVCGPTVYDRAHLGNARPVLVFDVLFRLLRHVYGEDHVTYVRNFTDVDDKINATALARKEAGALETLEELISERAEETIGWYLADMGALGALEPTEMPRATEYIAQMVTMIEKLIAEGFAYAKDGHVLFRVRKYEAYGKLSGRSVDDMIAGARVEVAPYKEDPMDFVLWKPSDDALPGWDSPWGRGRPGWHIECSAMADELLWDKPAREGRLSDEALQNPHVFDIHGGGLDLQFPHHEDEIAQSCCANQTDEMAQIWMHNEMLQVEGKKMSKSLGNFFTVRDLLDQGVPGEVIRFVMLSTHYRKPMDWTEKKAEDAARTLYKWRTLTDGVVPAKNVPELVLKALSEDLNTSAAISHLYELEDQPRQLLAAGRLLGLLGEGMGAWFSKRKLHFAAHDNLRELLMLRAEAKKSKDYQLADRIRDELLEKGIELRDLPDGTVQPRMPLEKATDYYKRMSPSERREVYGDLLSSDGRTIDSSVLADRYQAVAVKEILAKLQARK